MTDPTRLACFFSTSGHSGVDRVARHLIPAFARRGYRVDLLRVRRHGPDLPDVPPGVRLIDLGTRHTYAGLPAVAGYLRRARPVVLLSDKDRVNRVALLARWLAGVPTRLALRSGTTISVDLASRGSLDRWLQRQSMSRLYRFADHILVNAEAVAQDMAEYAGLARARLQVVPNPVVPAELFDRALPRPAHPWFAPGAAPVLLGLGELCARKDFSTLIRAFAEVRRVRPCRLMILGRGGQREDLRALAGSLGLGEWVSLPGFVPDPYPYLAHAALLAVTSLWEGNPFVIPEALAVGTPVVATDCPGGSREVLDHGRYGPLVPRQDSAALARALLDTLAHPLSPEVLRQAARPFEIERSATAYLGAMGLASRLEPALRRGSGRA